MIYVFTANFKNVSSYRTVRTVSVDYGYLPNIHHYIYAYLITLINNVPSPIIEELNTVQRIKSIHF